MVPFGLKIENLLNAAPREDVVISTNTFLEAQLPQSVAELVKRNIRVGRPTQDTRQKSFVSCHSESYTTFAPFCLTVDNSGHHSADHGLVYERILLRSRAEKKPLNSDATNTV